MHSIQQITAQGSDIELPIKEEALVSQGSQNIFYSFLLFKHSKIKK